MPAARRVSLSRTALLLLLGAAVVSSWLTVGPEQAGGPATYAVTSGVSMAPLLRNGDLALVRREGSYRVGQVVLYESRVLHRPVLHRIIAVRHGRYYFKGDNNDFVDPGYATRSRLIGRLYLVVPALGGVLSFFADPIRAAVAAGLASFLLVATLTGPERRSRRPRRRLRPLTAGR